MMWRRAQVVGMCLLGLASAALGCAGMREPVGGARGGGPVTVRDGPRPVVLVHGLGGDWTAWTSYLGEAGYLRSIGRRGYAVGDGQGAGTMNTGGAGLPVDATLTIAENADILGWYIADVKRVTGAAAVDIVAHSMGGLIARDYIHRVMTERDVGVLVMLGTPNGGSDCAAPLAAMGLRLPAALELRPLYLQQVFNKRVTRRRGVPFHIVAGTRVTDAALSPCGDVPSDQLVSRQSATTIPATVVEVEASHTELRESRAVFERVVRGILAGAEGALPEAPEPTQMQTMHAPLQFAPPITGTVGPRETREHVVEVDAVAVTSFTLSDPSRSLVLAARSAGGRNVEVASLGRIDGAGMLLQMSYGLWHPESGPWRIVVRGTEQTPAEGTTYGVLVQYRGGAELRADIDTWIPVVGETATLVATLDGVGPGATIEAASAEVRRAAGGVETLALMEDGSQLRAAWRPEQPGLHGIDIAVTAVRADGQRMERSVFLTVEAIPSPAAQRGRVIAGAALVALAVVGWLVWRRRLS